MSEIYAALANVMADCSHVAKRDTNTFHKFHFRGIDAVVNAVGPILRKHQVVVAPVVQSVTYEVVGTSQGKPATACRVVVAYRFYAVDGSSVETVVAAEAWDAGDKATPKAMSVAFRTALLQALALPTDEPDPDSFVHERGHDAPPPPPASPMSAKTRGQMFALFGQKGIDEDKQLAGINQMLGTTYTSRGDLTESDARRVCESLKALPDASTITEGGTDE